MLLYLTPETRICLYSLGPTTEMKRPTDQVERQKKTPKTSVNKYNGSVVVPGSSVATVEELDGFYNAFVKTRTPAKIVLDSNHPVQLGKFDLHNIAKTLGYPEEKKLQVERKTAFGFGLGKSRELMSFTEIVEKLKAGDDSYYLTTQYDEHDVVDDSKLGDISGFLSDSSRESDAETSEIANMSEASENDEQDDAEDGNKDEESEEESDTNAEGFGNFSETSSLASLDMNDLHDDFDTLDTEEYINEELKLTSEEAEDRVKSLFQAPLTELAHAENFPVTPKPFETLVPQQINLWMGLSLGTSPKPDLLQPTTESLGKWVPHGNSSGLHHDHADNLYVLIEGRKRFTLYSPKDAHKLFTVGDIDTVFSNGLIDYKINKNARYWRKMREDGSLFAEHAAWLLENEDFSSQEKEELERLVENEEEYDGEIDLSLDPPSFSTVPPVLAHLDELTDAAEIASLTKFAEEKFPGFLQLQKVEVWLNAGDMLYLPCGWFHEVTSYANEKLPAHIAMNWWFMPPDGETETKPYRDDYWKQDFAKTIASIEFSKRR